jgi:hypothetical protein
VEQANEGMGLANGAPARMEAPFAAHLSLDGMIHHLAEELE